MAADLISEMINEETFPDHFYKYRSVSTPEQLGHLERMVVHGEVYFAQASTFNDPLDLSITPSFDASNETIRAYWEQHLKLEYPGLRSTARKQKAKQFLLETRTPAGQARLINNHRKSIHKCGVLSLCTNPTSTLMWSYYSGGHSGVAVRFSLDEPAVQSVRPFMMWQVHYAKAFPRARFYIDPNDVFIKAMVATKSFEWAHEHEWRLVRPSKIGAVEFPRRVVDAVIFGLNTTDATKAMVRSWAARRRKSEPLELLQVAKRPDSFEVSIGPAAI